MNGKYDYYSQLGTPRGREDARLALQANTGMAAEASVLQSLNLTGKSVLFLGCGPGYYEEMVCRKYQPASAIATDIDQQSVKTAAERGLPRNLNFQAHDATLPFPGQFDTVLERFLLIQVPETAMRTIVSRMVEAATPGGQVVLIEYENSARYLRPECPGASALFKAMRDRFHANGADPDLGLSLANRLIDAGLQDVRSHNIDFEYAGADFNSDVICGEINFGPLGEIIFRSHEARYGKEMPEEVLQFHRWMKEAQAPGSTHATGSRYIVAVGRKPVV